MYVEQKEFIEAEKAFSEAFEVSIRVMRTPCPGSESWHPSAAAPVR
jgi:hypothetical protein